jgi:mRNA interferase HigB
VHATLGISVRHAAAIGRAPNTALQQTAFGAPIWAILQRHRSRRAAAERQAVRLPLPTPAVLAPCLGSVYTLPMRIIAKKTLRDFWERYPDSEAALRAWYHDAKQAAWSSPQEIRQTYATASIVANNRVVFNIRGNTYRLIVAVNYTFGIVYIRFIGTHSQYDQVDATTI